MSLPTAAAPEESAVSHCLLDAHGSVLDAQGADRPYYAASTIKLHVLLAALREAGTGRLDLTASVPAIRSFTGANGAPFTLGGDHLDPMYPAEGAPVEVQELLRRMIDRSSNEATDHVIELLGLDSVEATIIGLGLRSTRVERLIGDAAALRTGATNETSAADLALTMRAAVTPYGLAPPLSASSLDLAREALRAQRIPVIGSALREGVRWGSKSGWVDGFRHDVAFVGDPDGEDLRVLAVMTAGLAPEDADRRITDRARELLPDVAG
ncbi:MAG: class A beta-lactamase-related serine hydrolase [Brachybacterium sp.]|nr:class A beta-lactamase-related serine hydrolase [Brachybacterium sp.]